MRKLIILLAALCCSISLFAIPAYKGLIRHTQPDGSTIMIRLHGDEFSHWVTDASGQVLEKDADGYYRPSSEAKLIARRAMGRARRAQANNRRRVPARAGIAHGQKHFMVILVQFSDVKFANENTARHDFTNLLNQPGYSVNGGTGSARDFYYDNSHGHFEPIFDVYGPVTLEHERAYYGGNDANGYDLRAELAVAEGCEAVDTLFSVNYNLYDNNDDDAVDLVFMYYAGQGEADSDCEESIWPHQYELSYAGIDLSLGGKIIDSYACTNEINGYGELEGEMCGIGTACHEFGHAMGLPDFYDTDYETNGEAHGLDYYSLMCSGSYNNEGRTPPYFNIEERIILGWLEPEVIREFSSSGNYVLTSVNNNIAYKTPTDMDGEYFVYECRSKIGWDAHIWEPGLIVYHVDKSSRDVTIKDYLGNSYNFAASYLWSNWEEANSINENGNHPCFYVVPSGAQDNLNYKGAYWAFPGNGGIKEFSAVSWNGVESDIELSNISYADNQVSLYAYVPSNTLKYNVIANPGNGVYAAGSVFSLALEESESQPVSSVEWYFDDEPVYGASVTLTAGTHLVEAHLTLASGASQTLELTLNVN